MFNFFSIPHAEPHDSHYQTDDANRITDGSWQMEGLFRHHQERRADGSHEEGWNQGDPERSLVAYQIDGQRPKREHRESLVAKSEILPDGVETVGVLNLPDKHRNRTGKHRDTDIQTMQDRALVQFQPLCHNQTT